MSNQRPYTLFMPATPRASPTLLPVTTQISSSSRSRVQKEHSTADDHRSFVSVSANEDPLSSSSASSNPALDAPTTFEWDNDVENELLSTPLLIPELSLMLPTSSQLDSQPSYQPTHTDNASLTFFDKFAQNAKRNSEIRRKGLMDELLKCEDDPLYFLHNGTERAPKKDEHQEDRGESSVSGKESTPDPELQTSPPSLLHPVDTVLHDLDHDYFSSGRLVPADINTHNDNDKTPSERLSSSFYTQSPTQPSPPTLAPPIMDSIISSDLHTLSDEPSSRDDINPLLSSSSSFSSRWMSNLLKAGSGTGLQQHGQAVTSTLESILGISADASSSSLHPPSGTSLPTAASTVSAIHRRNSSSLPIRHHQIPHQQPHASHTLPRSIVIKHTASPFGAHSYIPPSGAPGFRGESYDWDKGFSNELERELRGRSNVTGSGDEESSSMNDKERILETEMQAQYTRPGNDIGAFMEKKTGNLDMKGRRASTSPVLSQNLANLLRAYLPALSRLPRSWTLVYSLDQHGISLNTLYTRCEEVLSPSQAIFPSRTEEVELGTRGVLLIIKDAGGAGEGDEGAFGAWIADGGGLSMGKKGGKGYFGGGESFLWKFTKGNLQVYKTTGRNNYVALCEPEYISFGGGDGHYGLYLDDTLYDGSSAPCPTFNNEPLCSPGPKKAGTVTVEFECVGLEVWGMGP